MKNNTTLSGSSWLTSLALGLSFLFIILGVSPLQAQQPKAASEGQTIIIFDASGSMWGKVSGGTKIEIAREAIKEFLPTIAPDQEIGLMAYGHRRKGDCADIELLVPPGKGNRKAILDAVYAITPKGKTPLCDAVFMAANLMSYEEAKSTVILISDGIETCGKDPCAIGDQLAAKGINFVCHVVAFDITKEKNANLDCLSSKTGGLYVEAKDAKGLKDALNRVMKVVVKKKTTLILSGKNSAGKILSGVDFEIYQGKASETPLLQGRGGKYRTDLKPGDYTIVGKFGKLQSQATLKVPEDELTQHTLIFEATGLTAEASLSKDSAPLQKHLRWKVFNQAESIKSKAVAYSYSAKPTFNLAPGKYIVTVGYQKSSAQQEVEVTANQGNDIKLILGAGTLVAQMRMSEKSAPLTKHTRFELFDAPDVEGDRRRIAYSYDGKTNLIVPSGKYLLKATYKKASTQQEVEIKPNEKTEVMLTLGAGTLIAEASMIKGSEAIQKGLHWELLSPEDEEGKRQRVSYSYDPKPVFKVPSGEYRLRVKKDSAIAEQDVVITSGQTIKPVLVLNAGIWKGAAYMAENSANPVSDGVRWYFWQNDAEEARQKVAHVYGKKSAKYAVITLAAGTYTVTATRGKATAEKTITVTAGKITTDKITFNAGILDLSSTLISPGSSKFYAKVYHAEQETKNLVISFTNLKRRYYLPAGDYLIVITPRDKTEKKPADIKLTITAGKIHTLELK